MSIIIRHKHVIIPAWRKIPHVSINLRTFKEEKIYNHVRNKVIDCINFQIICTGVLGYATNRIIAEFLLYRYKNLLTKGKNKPKYDDWKIIRDILNFWLLLKSFIVVGTVQYYSDEIYSLLESYRNRKNPDMFDLLTPIALGTYGTLIAIMYPLSRNRSLTKE